MIASTLLEVFIQLILLVIQMLKLVLRITLPGIKWNRYFKKVVKKVNEEGKMCYKQSP